MYDLVRSTPRAEEMARWYSLADVLAGARGEIAATGKRLAQMPELIGEYADEQEARRWQAAARVEEAFVARLRGAGLADRAAARDGLIAAIGRGGAPEGSPRVVLAGVVDLNADARRLVGALGERCEAVVFAPAKECGGGFDEMGCVVPSWWAGRGIAIDESAIRVVHDSEDQADAALRVVEELGAGRAADQVTIGVPEPAVAQAIVLRGVGAREEARVAAGVSGRGGRDEGTPRFRLASGRALEGTAVGVFLHAAHEFITSRSFERFASLVRHERVAAYIDRTMSEVMGGDEAGEGGAEDARIGAGATARGDWLDVLDAYNAQHVHWMVDGSWHTTVKVEQETLTAVYACVMKLLGELAGGLVGGLADGETAEDAEVAAGERVGTVARWCDEVVGVVERLVGVGGEVDSDAGVGDETVAAGADLGDSGLAEVVGVVDALREGASLLIPDVRCDAARGLELVIRLMRDVALADESSDAAIELLGWLELAMDDAAVMVVTGMNEGVIPGPALADPLLPNSIRSGLGLPTRESRYARDAWIASTLAHVREATVFVCAKRGERNEPRLPSRLLLATDAMTVARRLLEWTRASGEVAGEGAGAAGELVVAVEQAASHRLDARRYTAPESLRVTAFRDYLSSPRGFYLKHIVGLEEVDANPAELDALRFGTLMHDVLRTMGESDVARSGDAGRIGAFLRATLDAAAAQRFGRDPMPAVWLQLQQAHARLEALARWQAKWAGEGWRIAYTEWSPPVAGKDAGAEEAVGVDDAKRYGASIMVDEKPMGLRGRIDRIDINERTGEAVIFDYKTGDTAPDIKSIRKGKGTVTGDWLDLQLPLYRHLVKSLALPEVVRLGYVVTPRDPGEAGEKVFAFTEEELATADETAREVVRSIRRGEFSELGPRPPTEGILARICGTGYLIGTEDEA